MIAVAIAALIATSPACAQDPAFTFTHPESKPERWKASAQLGVTATTGNSQALGGSATARVARRFRAARLAGEARGAYARSRVDVATDANGVPGIGPGEVETLTTTSTESWELRARADRYFGERNSLYASAASGGDRPAGKRLVASGQVGYARALALTPVHEITLELGYDLAHQDFVTQSRPVTSHSARAFLGYQVKPVEALAVRVSVDVLANVAPEDTPTRRAAALEHERILGRAEIDLKVDAKISLGLRTRARYDSVPAPRPAPDGATYEAGFTPLADRLDTSGELVLVYTLL